ncbi:MAG: insulinase family protein [Epsilonproteobacteria bacterium]|nr:insulinase family protein [Campylobacterota bacterium]
MNILIFSVICLVFVGIIVSSWFYVYKKRQGSTLQSFKVDFPVPKEKVKKVVLDNGMTLLAFANPSIPKVLVQIAYDVGSYVEKSGERGLAHLIEHMIFKGTQKLKEGDIDSIARKYGASFNAYTSMDVTSYYFETNKNNWKPFVGILADCMQNSRFEQQHLASEVKAVIQELKMGKDDYVRKMLYSACQNIFPPHHPYHMPVIGFKEDLLDLDAQNLKKFYEQHYGPSRATLFVAGDVDLDEIEKEFRQNFSSIKGLNSSSENDVKFPLPMQEVTTHSTRLFEDVQKEQLGLYWLIPGSRHEQEVVASVIEAMLGDGNASILSKLLVDELKIATSVYVKALKFARAGIFLILAEPVEGKSDACMQAVQKMLEKIAREGVDERELARAAKMRGRRFFQKMENLSSFINAWIDSYFATKDELAVFKRPRKLFEVTNQIVQEYVSKHLDPFLMNRVQVLPLPESKKELVLSLKKQDEELEKDIVKKHTRTAPLEQAEFVHTLPEPCPLEFAFPKPSREFVLDNGLKVLLHKKATSPLISVCLQFRDGHLFSDAKEGYLVEIMMDMLPEGSVDYSKEEIADFFEQNGAVYSFYEQGARFVCLANDIEPLFDRFMHVMTQPAFSFEALKKLKTITVDGLERAKDYPKARAVRAFKSLVYKNHPFAWDFDEVINLTKKVGVHDLRMTHQQYVVPSNMVLSIVGDFDLDHMQGVITEVSKSWQNGEAKVWDQMKADFDPGQTLDIPMLRDQVVLLLGQPSQLTIYDQDFVPLKLLNTICFRSLGSRLYELREQTGLFYWAFGGLCLGASQLHGYDVIGSMLSPDKVELAEQKMREMLVGVGQGGVKEDELKAAQQIYIKDLLDLISDNGAIARTLCYLDALKLGFDYYDKVLERVQGMQLKDMNDVAAKYCKVDDMVRVRVGRLQT